MALLGTVLPWNIQTASGSNLGSPVVSRVRPSDNLDSNRKENEVRHMKHMNFYAVLSPHVQRILFMASLSIKGYT